MHQLINKNKIYFYIFSLIILSSILNIKLMEFLTQQFLIKEINIITDNSEIRRNIINKTESLKNINIFQVKKGDIEIQLGDLNYLEQINIKKNYPFTLIIEASKTKLLGITYINQKKYYVGNNGEFISTEKISNNKNLPIIFGEFEISHYFNLIKNLKKQNIDHKLISKYYFHKNKRWDLYFDNNILIKLPNKNLSDAINLYKIFKTNNEIKPNMIIDLRIQNRVIINYG